MASNTVKVSLVMDSSAYEEFLQEMEILAEYVDLIPDSELVKVKLIDQLKKLEPLVEKVGCKSG